MKKIFSVLVALVCMAHNLMAQYDPKALTILDGMSEKYKAMSSFKAAFTYTLENPNGGKQAMKGDIIVKGPKFHLKMGNQEIINNGTTVWTILHDQKEVNISDYEPDEDDITPTKIYTLYKKGYKYSYIEQKKDAAGKLYDVIELQPENRNNQFFKIRLEVYVADKSIKSWRLFEKNGNKYDYVITALTPNFPVTDPYFNYDPKKYAGYQSVDLR